jgi:hypothetical protein
MLLWLDPGVELGERNPGTATTGDLIGSSLRADGGEL